MNTPNELIGKTFTHPQLNLVIVDGVVTGSRTKVNITVLDKGKGWNEKTQSYKGYKNSVGWMRGENRQYLFKDTVHIKDLKPCN